MAVAMLRGVNLGSYQKIKMDALKTLCTSLGLRDVQTYIQSGNLVFREDGEDPGTLARRLEKAIEAGFGFRPSVIVRTASELRKVIAKNPFAGRAESSPTGCWSFSWTVLQRGKPVISCLGYLAPRRSCVSTGARSISTIPTEWLTLKIPLVRIEKTLQCASTGRNWNTVNKLMAMAEALEGSK